MSQLFAYQLHETLDTIARWGNGFLGYDVDIDTKYNQEIENASIFIPIDESLREVFKKYTIMHKWYMAPAALGPHIINMVISEMVGPDYRDDYTVQQMTDDLYTLARKGVF